MWCILMMSAWLCFCFFEWKGEGKLQKIVKTSSIYGDKNLLICLSWPPLSISAPFISLKDLWSGVTLSSTTHSHSQTEPDVWTEWMCSLHSCSNPVRRVTEGWRSLFASRHTFHVNKTSSRRKCKDIINSQNVKHAAARRFPIALQSAMWLKLILCVEKHTEEVDRTELA